MKSTITWISIALISAFIVGAFCQQATRLADLRQELDSLRQAQRSGEGPPAIGPTLVPYLAQTAGVAVVPSPGGSAISVGVEPAASANRPVSEAPRAPVSDERWQDEVRAHETAVEAAFVGELVDRSWASDAGRELRSRLRSQIANTSSLRDVDCRSSLCRVEMIHPNADTADEFIHKAFLSPEDRAWPGPGMTLPPQENSDGTLTVVVYLGREGDSLSRIGL